MPKGKYVKCKNGTPCFVVAEDDAGNQMDLEIEYYEKRGYEPAWNTLRREDQQLVIKRTEILLERYIHCQCIP